MDEQNKIPEWVLEENEQLDQQDDYEKLPALKFEENKITEFTVDFSEKFEEFPDKFKEGGIRVKIPVEHNGEKKILWLNKLNPLRREILKKGKEGITTMKAIQTGNKANTKYNLVED